MTPCLIIASFLEAIKCKLKVQKKIRNSKLKKKKKIITYQSQNELFRIPRSLLQQFCFEITEF